MIRREIPVLGSTFFAAKRQQPRPWQSQQVLQGRCQRSNWSEQTIKKTSENNQIPRTNSYSVDKLKFKVQSTITNFKEINYDKLASLNYAKNILHSSLIGTIEKMIHKDNSMYDISLF